MDNWCLLCKNTIETNNYNIDEYLTKYSNLLLRQVLESLFDSVVFLESDSNMCYSCFELLNDFDLAEINYKRVRRKILDFFNSSDSNESSNRQKVCDETPKPVEGLDEFIKKETFETEVVLADVDENETKINIFENVFVPGDQNENVAEVKKPNPKGKGKKAKMVLKPFSCSECTKTFKTSSELKSHVSTHSNTRPYICEICGQAYKHKYALNVHVGMHKGICPFICMYCNKSFTQKGALQRHLPIHTGDKQFQCDLCGKRFVHHSSFNVHQLSHSGEKLHKCTECGLALFSGSHLKRHMRVHTGERNFVCTICDKRFAERYNLVAHEKLHNNGDANTSYKRNHSNTKMLQNTRSNTKHRQYDIPSIIEAAKLVVEMKWTIYKAAKQTGVPWSTLKNHLSRNNKQNNNLQVPKMGRPYALTADLETELYNYIITMQELGFGLSIYMIRNVAYKLAQNAGRENFFKLGNDTASKWWWSKFKKRFNLNVRVPENIAASKSSMAKCEVVNDFFFKLDALIEKLGIRDMADRFYNCDETGLSYVVKEGKMVTSIGKRFVYKKAYANRGETHTLLGCVCADGSWIPPLVVFKSVQWNDNLKTDCFRNAQVKFSPKGWISSKIFLEWFQFFIQSIPKTRPIILFMDSHASYIKPEIITLAKENDIYLFTFPAHTSRIIQPLDVGVYKTLKSHWSESLDDYLKNNPTNTPNRTNFLSILYPAYIASFSASNICNAFRISGIFPLNKATVPKEVLASSLYEENNLLEQDLGIHSILVPIATDTLSTIQRTTCKGDSTGQGFNFINDEPSTSSGNETSTGSKKTKSKKHLDDDWKCGVCKIKYSRDLKAKNEAKWVQCSYCLMPYHVTCQSSGSEEEVFMCDHCSKVESQQESDSD